MTAGSKDPTPPEGLPDSLISELRALTPEELRKTVVHAQELLNAANETTLPIDPGKNEDIISITEHDNYTEVIKTVNCADGCEDCPHGPYLYHVTEEPEPGGGTHTHWTFLGTVQEED
ncbi:hypothetical protein [Halovenus marina]|uniref:hypothetical protein n=1 Tax=Halovenus marina TaxID=3396621 RepID=UPI003F552D8F